MTAEVLAIYQPKTDAMRQHVEHLFGGYLDGYHDGKIELAWTDTVADTAGKYRLRHGRLFGTDQIDDLIEEAARLNRQPFCNVYIGAALRKPEAAPFSRGDDKDALALTAVYVDLDDPGAATAAKEIYGKIKPTLVVVTGRAPHVRAQMWWKLDEPCADPEQWSALLKGMAAAMRGDSTVYNPSRVMRLAGTIAWPVKDGRSTELTDIAPLKEPGQAAYALGHMTSLFPPIQSTAHATAPSSVTHTTNSLGLADKINDGRERYMVKLTAANLIEFIGENGTAPTAQELFEASWPTYERKVDFTRSGRGADEYMEKCAYTVARFEAGKIRGVETMDKAIEVYRNKAQARANAPKQALPEPVLKDGKIKTVDFLTLLTEVVEEEPDLIEPGFASAGNFVLVAGPPKAQKSWCLQEMLVSCATGSSFLMNTFRVPRPLKVFWLNCEMNRKLLRKRARELKFLTADQRQLLGANLRVSERFHMLLNDDGVKTTIETIKADFPDGPPDIIAIDPLANVFDQENENDSVQLMRFLVGRVEAVRQAINPDAVIVMVHHATKRSSEDMAKDPFIAIRGAGALRGYYDSAIVIFKAAEESKQRKVHFELRSGESPEPITVELVSGRFQTSSPTASITKDIARDILGEIEAAWLRSRPWSPHERSKVEGRYAVLNASKMFGVPPKAVKALIDEWIFNGVVTFVERDQRKHPAGFKVTGSID